MRLYLTSILLYMYPILVKSWSGDAHRVIMDIAISMLKHETNNHLIQLTRTRDFADLRKWLITASKWADETDAGDPIRAKYHFVHTSTSCEPYDAARDCDGGVCLVTGIKKHIRTMVSAQSSPSQRVTALKYLIHFMADLHQPLHVGFRSDRGGNTITGVMPYNRDLHSIWDNALFYAHKGAHYKSSKFLKGPQSYSMKLAGLIGDRLKQSTEDMIGQKDLNLGKDVEALIVDILEETSSQLTCPLSYSLDGVSNVASGDTLGARYIAQGSTAVANQIMKAGVRLAKLMDALAAKYQDNFADLPRATAEQENMEKADIEARELRKAIKAEEKKVLDAAREAKNELTRNALIQQAGEIKERKANQAREKNENEAAERERVIASWKASKTDAESNKGEDDKATPVLSKKEARAEKKKALKVSSEDNLHRAMC